MTTHWSVVRELTWPSGQVTPERTELALTQLCRDYWPPLYRFVRQRGYNRHDAQDLTQGFFAYLLEKKAYSTTDRSRGRFRTFPARLAQALPRRGARSSASTEARRRSGGGFSG